MHALSLAGLAGLVVLGAVACGGSPGPRAGAIPDDLDLGTAFARRNPSVLASTLPVAEAVPTAKVRVDVVAEDCKASGPDGPRLDITFREADVTDGLRMIASAANVGLVVADDVHATMSLELERVTWRQAIEAIAHLEGLDVTEQDGIVIVTGTAAARL